MILKVFAVLDEKAKCFLPPFNAANNAVAVRMFDNGVQSPETLVSKYPEDYCLYALAEFDDNTGKYKAIEPIERVVKATELVALRAPSFGGASAPRAEIAAKEAATHGKK